MIKAGSLVRYMPNPSSTFKWGTFVNVEARNPGIVIEEVDKKCTTTRRYKIRWRDGKITEEWISYLEIYE